MSQGPERGSDQRGGAGNGRNSPPISGAEFAGLGLQFALSILLFIYVGRWLDGRLGSAPWLTVAGAFVGAAAGFYALVRRAKVPPSGGAGGAGRGGRQP